MYDPARDIFTSSDDAAADGNVTGEHSDRPEAQVQGVTTSGTPLRTEKTTCEGPKNTNKPDAIPSSDPHLRPLSPKTENQIAPADNFKTKKRKRSRSPAPDMATKRKASSEELQSQPTDNPFPPTKRPRPQSFEQPSSANDPPLSMTTANLPKFSRKIAGAEPSKTSKRARSPRNDRKSIGRSRSPISSRRSRSPEPRRRERRSPPRRRNSSPAPLRRTPTPPPRSPPRKLKRPGGASRITPAEREANRRHQLEREAEQQKAAAAVAASRGVHDVVRQHYNAVPERGREWRKTGSQIPGLRNFNNWVKSTVIQRFSPTEGEEAPGGLLVLDMGCGKGGDLSKWDKAPQKVGLYVGVDPAEVSIDQAKGRYADMERKARRQRQHLFDGKFYAKDGFGESLADLQIVRDVGFDGAAGPGAAGAASARWGGGGFDVVTMMFSMHYAFESEHKARGMLRNVSGSLKKGGRFLGVIPNSDILSAKVEAFHQKLAAKQTNGATDKREDMSGQETQDILEWGNNIYTVRFAGKTPQDGVFRPPFGWKYSYSLVEAVEAPEYVVPWEAFRALAEDYNLELSYRKPFTTIWDEEKNDRFLGPLSERMGVWDKRHERMMVSPEEMEAAGFYHAFCFYKV